jgi:class 3 adenylate cyclase
MTEINSLDVSDATRAIDTLNKMSEDIRSTVPDEALRLAAEALELSERADYADGRIHALINLAYCDYIFNKNSTALEYAYAALRLAEGTPQKTNLRKVYTIIGRILKDSARYTEALEYLHLALSLKDEGGADARIAALYNDIGTIHFETGDFAKAIEYCTLSTSIYEELNDRAGIAGNMLTIGNIYKQSRNADRALKYQKNALTLFEEIGEKSGIARAMTNIGNIYTELMSDHSRGLEFYMKSLALKEELNDKSGIVNSLVGIGNVYYGIPDDERALEYYLRSIALLEEIGKQNVLAKVLANIGLVYKSEDFAGYDIEKALEYTLRALAIAREVQMKDFIFKLHNILSELYEKTGDTGQALDHFKRFHSLKEELYNAETTKLLHDLEHKQMLADLEKERELERREQKATFKILNRVLPRQIVDRMKSGEENIADKFESASVLFADIVGFTPLAEKLGADEVLKLLSGIFSHFDVLCEKYGVEKIKTVGDSYMAVAGVPIKCDEHVFKIAKLALAMLEDVKLNLDFKIPELSIRIGIHTGEVIAGVLGTQKLSYDIWGDTVNTAARMESHGEPDTIHCTHEVYELLKDKFLFKERGEIEIKGKGRMKTYFLLKER